MIFYCWLLTLILSLYNSNCRSDLQENGMMTKIFPTVSGKFQPTMKAVGLYQYLPISDENSLIDLELKLPKVEKNEVLVEVKAISVNPIDTKIRAPKPYIETFPRILGWEGSGTVVGKSLLIINSGGGVGSVATQLAANLKLKVIGTASRRETEEFSRKNGAQIVLNHTKDLLPQLKAKGFGNGVDYILVNNNPYPYWDVMIQAIKPKGKICLIVNNSGLVDIKPLKDKKVVLVSEMMTTNMNYDTKDKGRHHEILKVASKMFDNGTLRPTVTKTLSPINAATLREAHRLIEERRVVGKLVLSGF
ncbi:zinc-type alcohol dehydrogenase-like protein SE_1777 [Papilio machaon]|uniref:zinc-type alcohol dehydrogenase-like protein SE_1777 n=1 Tax=Papilio machaon TaxID=76193 RepID=UPI001E66426E|nr:zinc-type alcohol dehydrogenase-like protein SE_1777 [Papilio machaon]